MRRQKPRIYKTRQGAERYAGKLGNQRLASGAPTGYATGYFAVMPYAPLGIPDARGRYVVALMENGRVRAYCS